MKREEFLLLCHVHFLSIAPVLAVQWCTVSGGLIVIIAKENEADLLNPKLLMAMKRGAIVYLCISFYSWLCFTKYY